MASGSFSKAIYTTSGVFVGKVILNWNSTADVNTNTSTVTVTASVESSAKAYRLRSRAYTINCIGGSANGTTASTGYTLATKTFTVKHNSDGSKSGTISFYVAGFTFTEEDENETVTTFTVNSFSVYGTAKLDKLNVGATISCETDTLDIGQETTFTIGNTLTAYTYKVRYVCGAASGIIKENATSTVTWKTPMELAIQIPNTTSGIATIYVDTYNGTALIGSSSITLTLTVPESIVPIIDDLAITDTTGYRQKYGDLVKGKSTFGVNVTALGSYGSEITSCKITINGNTTAGTTATGNILVGTNTITVNVTDTRGRTATVTETEEAIEYINPTIALFKAYRCNSDGTDNTEGGYIKAEFKAYIQALNNRNSKLFKLEYRLQGTESWNTHSTWNTTYTVDSSVIIPADTESSYELQLSAIDDFSAVIHSIPISSAFVLLDFNKSGKGMAIGKVSESDILDVAIEALFRKGVKTINGADLDELATDVTQIKATLGL